MIDWAGGGSRADVRAAGQPASVELSGPHHRLWG